MPANEINNTRSLLSRVADILLKIAAFFIILEPIWMLLPFAGFLYGSVMHIELLSSNPALSWLVYFVLPTHTLFPIGLILVVLGFLIFLVGAIQIYTAKLLKRGMVKNGIYRFFRHPQYVSLSVFCIGIILTWGRFITYIAFFIMLWLYYYLSKNEERQCESAFGAGYDDYKKNTWFLFPGEQVLFRLWALVPKPELPKAVAVAGSFILVLGFAIASGFGIQWVRTTARQTIPCIQSPKTPTGTAAVIDVIMVKGPAMQAAPFEKARTEFMDKQFKALMASERVDKLLGSLGLGENNAVLVFLTPGRNWHDQMDRHDSNKVNLFILILKAPVKFNGNNFGEFRRSWEILKGVRVEDFSYQSFADGKDPAEGEIKDLGPPQRGIPEFQRARFEERVNFFLSGL